MLASQAGDCTDSAVHNDRQTKGPGLLSTPSTTTTLLKLSHWGGNSVCLGAGINCDP